MTMPGVSAADLRAHLQIPRVTRQCVREADRDRFYAVGAADDCMMRRRAAGAGRVDAVLVCPTQTMTARGTVAPKRVDAVVRAVQHDGTTLTATLDARLIGSCSG